MRLRGISDLLPQAIRAIWALPDRREYSQSKHGVNQGFMTAVDDLRPEATLLIGLSSYALQRQTSILYELTRQSLRWHSIGWSQIKSMMQAK